MRHTQVADQPLPEQPRAPHRKRRRGYAAMRLGHRDTMVALIPGRRKRQSRGRRQIWGLRVTRGGRESLAA